MFLLEKQMKLVEFRLYLYDLAASLHEIESHLIEIGLFLMEKQLPLVEFHILCIGRCVVLISSENLLGNFTQYRELPSGGLAESCDGV